MNSNTLSVLSEVGEERARQDAKFPDTLEDVERHRAAIAIIEAAGVATLRELGGF